MRADLDAVRHAAAHEQIGRAQEGRDKFGLRMAVQIVGRAHLKQTAEIHHTETVGQLEGLLLIVRHQDRGDAEFTLNRAQGAAQFGADLGIQRAQRLIEQEHLGSVRQRARQGHALLLPAGELAGHAIAQAGQADQFQQFITPPAAFDGRHLANAEAKFDVVRHGHVLKEGVVLKNETDSAPLRRHGGDVTAMQQNAAVVNAGQASNHVEHGGLAAAAGAKHDKEFAVRNLQRHVVDHRVAVVAFGQVFQDNGHKQSPQDTSPFRSVYAYGVTGGVRRA